MNDIHHLPGKAEAKAVIRQHRKASFYVKKYLMIFMGALIAAIGLELFLIPNNVIDGGIVGIVDHGAVSRRVPGPLEHPVPLSRLQADRQELRDCDDDRHLHPVGLVGGVRANPEGHG